MPENKEDGGGDQGESGRDFGDRSTESLVALALEQSASVMDRMEIIYEIMRELNFRRGGK